jgi:acyl transferase domain-containing protein
MLVRGMTERGTLSRCAFLSHSNRYTLTDAMEATAQMGTPKSKDPPTPIAIVGIGCRFSGGADSPEKLWQLLASGESTWSPIPKERWNSTSFFDPNPSQQGMHNSYGGHFLSSDPAAIDAGFWGLAAAECEALDPQHRVQLEVAYEALENAGITRQDVEGSDTAVYVGTFGHDYESMLLQNTSDLPKYHMIGIGTAIAANRISYQLDLRGPSVTIGQIAGTLMFAPLTYWVDTGCSGSLVAIHQACQSLRTGECRMALAGGVNLLLNPDQTVAMSLMRCFSEEGRCYSFDSRGTGYGRGEGAAIVALKRLDDAIRDGNPIRAVIRNSGVNQDGKTKGIMVPNSEAQKSLIESVYREARLDPRDTPVVEAHGTGTQVGDPLEVSAIREAFRDSDETTHRPLYLGSIKPNIGHLESASGIASLIKGVVMLENRRVPATIGIEQVKPSLRLDDFGMKIPDQCVEWPADSIQRLSVNNFGYGGTNAHVILEAAPAVADEDRARPKAQFNGATNGTSHGHSNHALNGSSEPSPGRMLNGAVNGNHESVVASNTPQIISLSAESRNSLDLLRQSIASWASMQSSASSSLLKDLAYTLTARRTPMRHRIAFSARSIPDVVSQSSSSTISSTKSSLNPQLAFIFTGQGAQYATMARSLIPLISPFRTSLQRSEDTLLQLGTSWSLLSELCEEEANARIHEPELSQAVTCAVQIALVDLLAFLDVTPDVVLGHSSGEIAAAYACGAIDQETALAVAWYRGRCTQLQGSSDRRGAMLAVGLGEADCLPYLHNSEDGSGRAVIACANSPTSSTLSGDAAAVDKIEAALKADGVFARRLKVDRAYHSHHMQDVASQYLSDIQALKFGSPTGSTAFISSVTGQAFDDSFSAQYWVDNLVSKVRFADATRAALKFLSSSSRTRKSMHHLLVEIGPHNALAGPVRQTLSTIALDETTSQHATLVRGQDAIITVTALAGDLFVHGSTVSLTSLNSILRPDHSAARGRRVLTTLPSYHWNHSTRYWHESRLSLAHRFRSHPYHDLLGLQIPGQNAPRPVWRHIFSLKTHPWLQEHMIDGSMIFPASGYVAMVLEAMRQIYSSDPMNPKSRNRKVRQYELKDVIFVAPLVVPEDGASVELMLQLIPVEGSLWDDFRITGHNKDGGSTEQCHGSVTASMELAADEVEGERELTASRATWIESFNAVASSALKSIDTTSFYRDLREKGNAYGPHFACMTDLRTEGSQAVSKFHVPDTAQSMNGGTMRPHLIHPAVLDALLHPSIAVADVGNTSRSVVTAAIGSLKISSSLSSTVGSNLRSCTKLTDQWSQSCTADISVFHVDTADNLEPVLQIQGLRLQGLGLSGSGDAEADTCDNNFLIKWGIDADYLTPKDIDPYPAAETEEISRVQAHKLHILNQASALYIDECLQKISSHQSLEIVGNYQRLVKWMERFRASKGYTDLVSPIPAASGIGAVLDESSSMGVEGEILTRIGENLLAIVSGETEPLSLFTEQDLLWRLYADDASVRCYGYAIEYMPRAPFSLASLPRSTWSADPRPERA